MENLAGFYLVVLSFALQVCILSLLYMIYFDGHKSDEFISEGTLSFPVKSYYKSSCYILVLAVGEDYGLDNVAT